MAEVETEAKDSAIENEEIKISSECDVKDSISNTTDESNVVQEKEENITEIDRHVAAGDEENCSKIAEVEAKKNVIEGTERNENGRNEIKETEKKELEVIEVTGKQEVEEIEENEVQETEEKEEGTEEKEVEEKEVEETEENDGEDTEKNDGKETEGNNGEEIERNNGEEIEANDEETEGNETSENDNITPIVRVASRRRNISKEWSENYEGLEDAATLEDVRGDPNKEILWAAENNEIEILRKLLEENPTLCHVKDIDLYTPLHRACYNNHVEVIKILLSCDADISAKTIDDWTPLHCACKWDSVEAASLLLQNGADVNAVTKGSLTPLHLAASNPSGRRTLELLLWHPYINPGIKDEANDLAYDCAYRSGPFSTLFEILDDAINTY